jgi:hypothetical protein
MNSMSITNKDKQKTSNSTSEGNRSIAFKLAHHLWTQLRSAKTNSNEAMLSFTIRIHFAKPLWDRFADQLT